MVRIKKRHLTAIFLVLFTQTAKNAWAQQEKVWTGSVYPEGYFVYDSVRPKMNTVFMPVEDGVFGKWRFDWPFSISPSSMKIVKLSRSRSGFTELIGWPHDHVEDVQYEGSFKIKIKDPAKNKFVCQLSYGEHLWQSYSEKGLLSFQRSDYVARYFKRWARGFIETGSGDSSVFEIAIDYDNRDTALNHSSWLRVGGRQIRILPQFGDSTGCCLPVYSRRVFKGFDLLDGDKIIASSKLVHPSTYEFNYEYWMKDNEDMATNRAVATVLKILVKFF